MPSERDIGLNDGQLGWHPLSHRETVPLAGSQIASGAQTMPAVASSTTTNLSLTQFMRSVLSHMKMPLDPVRCAASHVVCHFLLLATCPCDPRTRRAPQRETVNYLPNMQVGPDNVPLFPGLLASSWDNGRIPHTTGSLGRLHDGCSAVESLERERVVAVAQVKVNVWVGAEKEDAEIPSQRWVCAPHNFLSTLQLEPIKDTGKVLTCSETINAERQASDPPC